MNAISPFLPALSACGFSPHLSLFPSLLCPCSRSSVTWKLQWQTAPAEEAPQPTGRPPTTVAALHPCRLVQQMMTARPTSLSTTCPRIWPRRSFAACLAVLARLSPASWFETRSQVLNGFRSFLILPLFVSQNKEQKNVIISFEVHQVGFNEIAKPENLPDCYNRLAIHCVNCGHRERVEYNEMMCNTHKHKPAVHHSRQFERSHCVHCLPHEEIHLCPLCVFKHCDSVRQQRATCSPEVFKLSSTSQG